jgi:hypothetical protein
MASTSQVSKFIAKYSPSVATQFRSARSKVRALFPRGYELVYDNYNALGCGFSTSPKGSGVLVSIVAYQKWVTLFFFYGTRLSDPDKLLQGSGSRIRSIRLVPAALLQPDARHPCVDVKCVGTFASRRQGPLVPSGYPLRHTDGGTRPVPPSLQTGKYLTCRARRSSKPWIRPIAQGGIATDVRNRRFV